MEVPALNVSVMVFDPGTSGDLKISAPLRNAEAVYFPVLLKRTMDESGGWGAVRVLPDEDPSAELQITGRIINSDGIELSLHITARDSEGTVWLDRTYTDYSLEQVHRSQLDYLKDPFQDLYNSVSNDLKRDSSQGHEKCIGANTGHIHVTVCSGRCLMSSADSWNKRKMASCGC